MCIKQLMVSNRRFEWKSLFVVGVFMFSGLNAYCKNDAETKKSNSDNTAAIAGGTAGAATAVGIGAAAAGASSAGIAYGLGVAGSIVGGGMAAGVGVVAAVPLAVGGAVYGLVKGYQYFFGEKEKQEDNAPETDKK